MPYTTNIPAATDIPAQSQTLMQQNCTELQTAISRDHEPLGNANSGLHDKVSLVTQGAAPAFATNFGLYATAAAMLLHNGANNYDISSYSYNLATFQGSFTLPCGIIIKFGNSTKTGAGQVTLTTAFPGAILDVIVSPMDPNIPRNKTAVLSSIDDTQHFTVYASNYAGTAAAACAFYWLAIGY